MADIETLGIVDEIQTLVNDKLQVVSYKWLSRNFLVSSNAAKRLLQDFIEKHGTGLEIVYSLSGWLKNNPSAYHIRLVSRSKLEEAKLEFEDTCSIQVYSVQACIPKDPAALWNAEFVQAEELSKQAITVDNCLRDNRFGGVLNSFVKRNAGGAPVSIDTPQVRSGVSGPSKSKSAPQNATFAQPQQRKFQQPSPTVGPQSSNVAADVKSESLGLESRAPDSKPAPEKEKVLHLPPNKKKGQTDRNSSGSGGALANMWGRACVKPKPDTASTETKNAAPSSAASAEAQICAREALEEGSSDDDGQQLNVKRSSNGDGSRKRRVVFDFSDEEDEYGDAVNLASPDPPKKQSVLGSKQITNIPKLENDNVSFEDEEEDKPKIKEEKQSESKTFPTNKNVGLEEEKEDKPKVKEWKQSESKTKPTLREESPTVSNGKPTETSSENDSNIKDKVTEPSPKSPKRRKVLKTRIDERGREVTEVVWEGEEAETKPAIDTMKKSENNAVKNAINRPPETKKSPAMGSTAPSNQAGKAGSKKAGNKDPKQGNILSFFKKKG